MKCMSTYTKNVYMYINCIVGVPSFYLFKRKLPIEFLQELVNRYVPNLNYYIVPVIVSKIM